MRTLLGRGTGPRLIPLAVVTIVLAACAGSSAAPAPDRNGAYSGDVPSAAASAAPAAPEDGSGSGAQSSGSPATPDNSLQIVYTGSLQLVVADVDQAVAKAKTAVASAGGYIGASQESNVDDQPAATITYRIPATKWDETISAIRGFGTKTVSEQTQATEVGGQLVDLQARLANLRASETALQGIAQNTAKVSDLLEVQAQLTDVRGQIEVLDAQLKHLQDQVAYGTLVTTFGMTKFASTSSIRMLESSSFRPCLSHQSAHSFTPDAVRGVQKRPDWAALMLTGSPSSKPRVAM